MKKTIFLLAAVSFSCAVFAQSTKYTTAMQANLAAYDTAMKNPASLLALSNNFERIANAEKTQWLPYYYAALAQMNYGFASGKPEGYDAIADKAEQFVQTADKLQPGNSEISVLKSMIATLRMIADPMTRFMQYSIEIEKQIETAKRQDTANPRPYLIEAQNKVNTPEQFGGGCAASADIIKTGMDKFNSFKPAGELQPTWGRASLEGIVKRCQGK